MTRDAKRPPAPRELLAAYTDGIAELTPDERHRVDAELARDPAARAEHAEVRGLIDQLRGLPPEGAEPDWAQLERAIRAAVGSELPRPWWRRWTWLAPATTMVTAMAVLVVVMWSRSATVSVEPARLTAGAHEPAIREPLGDRAARPAEDIVPLWLDGAEVDVSATASADLLGEPTFGGAAEDEVTQGDDGDSLLPASDLAWVDNLDADALARAEHWLATAGAGKKG